MIHGQLQANFPAQSNTNQLPINTTQVITSTPRLRRRPHRLRDGAVGRFRGTRPADGGRSEPPPLPSAEKEIQAAKYRFLEAKIAAARRLERRRLLLERRAAEFASRALAARADIDATHARRLVLARDLSSTKCEIEEAERKEGDWDRFYESKRKEMEDFQAMSQQFEAEARKEVQRLKDLVSQLQSALQELQSNGMYSNDDEIAAAEARKSDLTAKKAKLEESLVSARQFRALLQQQLQKAFASQVGDQKAAQN